VLRTEATINDPGKFKVFRHKQGQDKNEPKQRLPMRKGVMDIPLRASVSQDINNRFMDDLATLEEKTPIRNFMDELTVHITKNSRRFGLGSKFGQYCTAKVQLNPLGAFYFLEKVACERKNIFLEKGVEENTE
jgi:hypothetical protein